MSWRDRARPVIQQVLAEHSGESEREIRRALSEAFPFGQKRYFPYKVWLDEIAVQMGKKSKRLQVQRHMELEIEGQCGLEFTNA